MIIYNIDMSTRTPTRRNTPSRTSRTLRTGTRRREITSDEVTKQLQQFETRKNNFKQKFDTYETYEEVKQGDEMLNVFKKSTLQAKIKKFIDRYYKQEIDKLERLLPDFKKEIVAISTNDKLKKEDKQQNLTDLKSNYQEMIQQLKDAMEFQPYGKFKPYTFVYYYHKKEDIKNELTKKKDDIADIQLSIDVLIEEEKERQELGHQLSENEREKYDKRMQELGHQLYEQYALLNSINLNIYFVELLGTNIFDDIVLTKMDIYEELITEIDIKLNSLTSNTYTRPNRTSIVGKKKIRKTKKNKKPKNNKYSNKKRKY